MSRMNLLDVDELNHQPNYARIEIVDQEDAERVLRAQRYQERMSKAFTDSWKEGTDRE